jgi:hypothetical protein
MMAREEVLSLAEEDANGGGAGKVRRDVRAHFFYRCGIVRSSAQPLDWRRIDMRL